VFVGTDTGKSGLVRGGRLVCERGGLGAVLDAEFGEDGADVVADGSGAEVQSGGDVGVATTGRQMREHFAFPDAELMWVGNSPGATGFSAQGRQWPFHTLRRGPGTATRGLTQV
jgi:hypothetical protein